MPPLVPASGDPQYNKRKELQKQGKDWPPDDELTPDQLAAREAKRAEAIANAKAEKSAAEAEANAAAEAAENKGKKGK